MFIFVRTLPWNNLWGNRLWFGRRYRSFIGTSHLHQGGTLVAFEFQSDAFFFSWWKSVLFLWLTFCIKTVHVFFFWLDFGAARKYLFQSPNRGLSRQKMCQKQTLLMASDHRLLLEIKALNLGSVVTESMQHGGWHGQDHTRSAQIIMNSPYTAPILVWHGWDQAMRVVEQQKLWVWLVLYDWDAMDSRTWPTWSTGSRLHMSRRAIASQQGGLDGFVTDYLLAWYSHNLGCCCKELVPHQAVTTSVRGVESSNLPNFTFETEMRLDETQIKCF